MWTLSIQEKKLLCIISTMLKAGIAEIGFPDKGTPQGGIIRVVLLGWYYQSTIIQYRLNESDWWTASQWEEMPTHYEYKYGIYENSSPNKSPIYTALRKTRLKECYIVRYADDFKVFYRKKDDAVKLFEAIRQWLKQ